MCKNIYILVDADCDGFCSSAILYQYLKKINPQVEIVPLFHEQKQHGLTDKNIMKQLLSSESGLVIIPDASGEEKQFKLLHDNGFSIIVLDHHSQDLTDSKYAIIVDNQYSDEVENKGLSGTGVTWKFLKALDKKFNVNYSSEFVSYVALSIISDSCPMQYEENRAYVTWGLKHIHKNLKPFFDVINKDIDNTSVSWQLVPLINSCVRLGTQEDKIELFNAMCGTADAKAIIKRCKSLHTTQQKLSQEMADEIKKTIIELKGGVIGEIEGQTTMTGLVAGKLSSEYMKPVLLVHNNGIQCAGSFRSPVPILEEFKNVKLFSKCGGHDEAGFVMYDCSNSDKINEFLNNLSIDGEYTVFGSYKITEIPYNIYEFSSQISSFIGQGINSPMIHIKPFILFKNNINYIGKSSNVMKFSSNGIDFVKFFVNDTFKEKFNQDVMEVEIVGYPEINEYHGKRTKQIRIEEIEAKEFSPI